MDARSTRALACASPGLCALRVRPRRLEAIERGEHVPDLVEWAELAQLYMLDAEDVARGLGAAWRERVGPSSSVPAPSAAPVVLMVPSPAFGAWLRCAARDTSIVTLATQLGQTRGVFPAQVAAWFHGRSAPDAVQWGALCEALNLSAEDGALGLAALRSDRTARGGR